LFQGLRNNTEDLGFLMKVSDALKADASTHDPKPIIPPPLPWVDLRSRRVAADSNSHSYGQTNYLLQHMYAHIRAAPIKPSRLATTGSTYRSSERWLYETSKLDQGFHIVFYELIDVWDKMKRGENVELTNTVPFYGRFDDVLRKSCVTVRHLTCILLLNNQKSDS
jgi:hypothetical protein